MISHCICRVCGLTFPSSRADAITCTDTCRQRLRRGGAFAYLAGLSPALRRAHRKHHDANDAALAAHRTATAAWRKLRDLKRARRQARADRERERMVAEIAGRAYLTQQKKKHEQRMSATVAGILTLFAQQRRNDMSATAIAEFLDLPNAYPVEQIEAAIERLRADGHYDRIVAQQ